MVTKRLVENQDRLSRRRSLASIVLFIAAALIFAASESDAANIGGNIDSASLLALASRQFANLTAAERAVLEYTDVKNVARTGDWAVCGTSPNVADASNDPKNAASWDHQRDVRALLVRWLAVDPEAAHRVDPSGLRILGARITGALDLKDAHLSFPLVLRNCSIPERMDFTAASFPRLDLNGCYTGEIEAHSLNVDSDLQIGNGFHAAGEVSFWGAKIGSDLNASNGHFIHSKVESQPVGAQWKQALIAFSSSIGGNVWVCCGFESDGDVSLSRSKIAGDVYAFGGRFINPDNLALDGSRSQINGSVFFAGFPPLNGPVVNGLGDFSAAILSNGVLVFNGVRFEGARGESHGLYAFGSLVAGVVWANNILENGATLNLRDVVAQGFYDDERSWPEPGSLMIDGFTYPDFGGSGRFFAEPPSDAKSRLKWLELQPKFHSQPYRQLAKVLASRGDDAGAEQVLIAMEDRRYASAGLGERIFGGFLKTTIGYGHRPLLTIFWSFAVVMIGWVIVTLAKKAGVMRQTWPENSPQPSDQAYEPLHPFLYSLDVFLPFVNLHQEHYWWPNPDSRGVAKIFGYEVPWLGSFTRYFLWSQIVAGWVLSAILLAGVTGLIRRD